LAALKILPQLFVKQKSRRIFKNDLSNSKVQILVLWGKKSPSKGIVREMPEVPMSGVNPVCWIFGKKIVLFELVGGG
jgi:hypothetical protein